MATTNSFFRCDPVGEQALIDKLIVESIQIYGIECQYLPRTLVAKDTLWGEDTLSKFESAYPLEMYVKSVDGFEGDGNFLSKFGLEIRDEMTLTLSRTRFSEVVIDANTTEQIGRPSEGDLIYFPLNGKIFEVKFVEHEAIFYQMGSLQTYDLRCELFEYSHEQLNTGNTAIDMIEDKFSGDKLQNQITLEDGSLILFEDGNYMVNESFTVGSVDPLADNEFYDTKSTDLNYIDWSESNPFGEL